jgi:hypothetical protein
MTGFKPPRILDFDIENRPGAYWYDGNPTSEVTAIAWSVVGESQVVVRALNPKCGLETEAEFADQYSFILGSFLRAYKDADVVTGHFIRKHDLPILNGAMIEWLGTTLEPKVTIDTKLDLVRWGGYAKTQENLGLLMSKVSESSAEYLANKEHMTQMDWRTANRLTVEGVEETGRRVAGDVRQHKALRLELNTLGLLKSPRIWRP